MSLLFVFWSSPEPARQLQIRKLYQQLSSLSLPLTCLAGPTPDGVNHLSFERMWLLVGPEAQAHLGDFLANLSAGDRRIHFLALNAEHRALIPREWFENTVHVLNSPSAYHILLGSVPTAATAAPAPAPDAPGPGSARSKPSAQPPPPRAAPPAPPPRLEQSEGFQLNLPSPPIMLGIGVVLAVTVVLLLKPDVDDGPSWKAAAPPHKADARRGRATPLEVEWVKSQVMPLWFSRGEITVYQYNQCVANKKCISLAEAGGKKCNSNHEDRFEHPVNCVSYDEATAFCRAYGGRLPRLAEWQREAQPNEQYPYPWGATAPSCALAVMRDGDDPDDDGCGEQTTLPICSRPSGSNISGLCDLAGNVLEWTSERYLVSHSIAWTGGVDLAVYYDKPPAERSVRVVAPNPPHAETTSPEVIIPIANIGFRCVAEAQPLR